MLALGGALLAGGIPSVLATTGPTPAPLGVVAPVASPDPVPPTPSPAEAEVPGAPAAPPSTAAPSRAGSGATPRADAETEAGARILRKQLGSTAVGTPARVLIPRLKVDQKLVGLDVLPDGSLEAPRQYSQVGWWQDGPVPGQPGAPVLVGHRDSPTGPAVFYGLESLRPGDTVQVYSKDWTNSTFRIRKVEQFPRDRFPSDRVYRRSGSSGLVLLTCGGQYDRAAGRYLDNVVVFADLVGKPKPRS